MRRRSSFFGALGRLAVFLRLCASAKPPSLTYSWTYDLLRLDNAAWNARVEATAMEQIQTMRATEADLVLLRLDDAQNAAPAGGHEFRVQVIGHNLPMRRTEVTRDFLVLRSGRLCRRGTLKTPSRTAVDLLSFERDRRIGSHVSSFGVQKLRFDSCDCWRARPELPRVISLRCDLTGAAAADAANSLQSPIFKDDPLAMASVTTLDGLPIRHKRLRAHHPPVEFPAAKEFYQAEASLGPEAELDPLRSMAPAARRIRVPYNDLDDNVVSDWASSDEDPDEPEEAAKPIFSPGEKLPPAAPAASRDYSNDMMMVKDDARGGGLFAPTATSNSSGRSGPLGGSSLSGSPLGGSPLGSTSLSGSPAAFERPWQSSEDIEGEEASSPYSSPLTPSSPLSSRSLSPALEEERLQSLSAADGGEVWPLVSPEDLEQLYGRYNVGAAELSAELGGPYICYASPRSSIGRARLSAPAESTMILQALPSAGRNVFVVVPEICAKSESTQEVPVVVRQFSTDRQGRKLEKQLTFRGCHCRTRDQRLHLDCHDKAHYKVTVKTF